jgi:hypothetical protein
MVYYGKVAPDIDTFMEHISKGTTPTTVTYQRTKGKKFWNIYAYNRELDHEPEA